LIARASARDWARIEALLALTLASLRAQTDQDFRVVIAGHDRPRTDFDDARLSFLAADWPAEPVRPDNLDSGRKKHAISEQVLAAGGGLLMFVDADDWIDRRLVETARAALAPHHVGGLIATGFATDLYALRALPLPHPRIFRGGFHRLCGSSTIIRLLPDDPDPLRRNPHMVLHEHYRWIEVARERGLAVARLPVSGNYIVNTSENHSELHGPYAEWRREFARRIGREGDPVDARFAARFGLRLEQIRAALPCRGHKRIP
jgi:glycosyltransferase involved in cell wall biosynthesis